MKPNIEQLSQSARQAIAQRNGRVLHDSFTQILQIDPKNAEGHFLKGIFFKVQQKRAVATSALSTAFELDNGRYDAAVELADLLAARQDYDAAKDLLKQSEEAMKNSPYYLNFAGEIYTRLGLHDAAWPLFKAANDIQKDAIPIETNLAASAAKVGRYDVAQDYYSKLLSDTPEHQRHHFEMSRLSKAKDTQHIQAMEALLEQNGPPSALNIFLYFALGKEYEDLEDWDKAFHYLAMGNRFAAEQAAKSGYTARADIDVLETIRDACDVDWLGEDEKPVPSDRTPIFIVGLPRTGTTLVERIISSHSQVETLGESFFLDEAIKRAAGGAFSRDVTQEIIHRAAKTPARDILSDYLNTVSYRASGSKYFIEKLPLNFLNVGFILKAMPQAKIVVLDRKPMDACFAMFKQPYFRFSYDLDGLADYYIAFDQLRQHWQSIAGDRIVWIAYEDLVHDVDAQIQALITDIGLDFEPACLDFHLSKTASATASFAQIRQKAHTGSVNKWLKFKDHLQPLAKKLEAAGIDVTAYKALT